MSATKQVAQDGSAVTVRIPLALRSRGGRKVVVSPDGQPISAPIRPCADNTLLRAVVQAFHWKGLLESGQFATVSELAAAEGLNVSYVSHVLRLTLLAPDLAEAILEGKQSIMMQLQPLMRGFPTEWAAQRAHLMATSRRIPTTTVAAA